MLSKLEGQCKVCSYLTYLNIIISWPYKPRQNPFLQNWIWCIYIFVILFIQFLQRGGRNRSSWIFGTSSYENDMQKRKWTLLFIYFNIALLSLLSYHCSPIIALLSLALPASPAVVNIVSDFVVNLLWDDRGHLARNTQTSSDRIFTLALSKSFS